MSRIIILTEGKSQPTEAKTATGVIRYRPQDVVAVYDSTRAGESCGDVLGVGGDLPIVDTLEGLEADTLLIGIAPAGGQLPDSWRAVILDAIDRGFEIVSGLHAFLSDDPEIGPRATERGVTIHDVRRPPPGLSVSTNSARHAPCFRVHTVGLDCGVGKMLVSLEIDRALRDRGRRSRFIATGQTGIMIAGDGVPIDAVVSDFVAGAIEELVLRYAAEAEFLLIEGQGSLAHPFYSGVTLGLLHGCAPQALVLCADPSRTEIHRCGVPTPRIEDMIRTYESMAELVAPSRVVGVTLNTSKFDAGAAERWVRDVGESTGLPTTDPVRFGIEPIVEAVLSAESEWRREGKSS